MAQPGPESALAAAAKEDQSGRAACSLGDMYRSGSGGLEKDYAAAARWYTESAHLGFPEGVYNLGGMLHHGLGIPKDRARAKLLLKQAEGAGLQTAKRDMDLKKAYRFLMEKGGRLAKQELDDKAQCSRQLTRAGVRCPKQYTFKELSGLSPGDFPIVSKPKASKFGNGITLMTEPPLTVNGDAVDHCCPDPDADFVFEQFAQFACDYRLLIIGGELTAAMRRENTVVTGDGSQTVKELLGGPSGGTATEDQLKYVRYATGLLASDIIPAGDDVRVNYVTNCEQHRKITSMPANIRECAHPSFLALSRKIAEVFPERSLLGVDIAANDITSWDCSDGGGFSIHEINARPTLNTYNPGQMEFIHAAVMEAYRSNVEN